MKQESVDWWTEAARAALQQVAGMTDREAAKVLGIGFSTVNRIRQALDKGEALSEPRGGVRRVLQRFAARGVGAAPDYNEAREEVELARAGALPEPLLRIMERESIAAVIRAQGVRDACRAAMLEAENAVNRGERARPPARRITPMEPTKPRRAGGEEKEAI